MASWRVRNHYGHGAGRVVLCTEPYRIASEPPSLRAGLRVSGRDLWQSARPALALSLVVLAAVALTLGRDRRDVGNLEVMVLRDARTVPMQRAKPKPIVELVRIPEVKPPVVERVDPPPVPEPRTVAHVDPLPKPPVVEPKLRPELAKPPPPVRPKIEIAAVAAQVPVREPKVAPRAVPRVEAPGRSRRRAIAAAVLVAPAEPRAASPSPSRRRVERIREASGPRPQLALATTRVELPDEPAPSSTRTRQLAFRPARDRARSSAALAPALTSDPAPPASPARRATRAGVSTTGGFGSGST